MTDETKKLFDAPWEADKFVYYRPSGIGEINIRVKSSKNELVVGYVTTTETANRLARVPELYDALANAVRYACQDCVDQVYDHPTDYDPVKYGCLFKDKNCCAMCRSWIELLRKVRDGE